MDSFSCRSPVFPEVDLVRDFSLLQKKLNSEFWVFYFMLFLEIKRLETSLRGMEKSQKRR